MLPQPQKRIDLRDVVLKIQRNADEIERLKREIVLVKQSMQETEKLAREAILKAQQAQVSADKSAREVQAMATSNATAFATVEVRLTAAEADARDAVKKEDLDVIDTSMDAEAVLILIRQEVEKMAGNIKFNLKVDPATGEYWVEPVKPPE